MFPSKRLPEEQLYRQYSKEELEQNNNNVTLPDLALENIWYNTISNPRVQEELDYKSRNLYSSSKDIRNSLYNLRESRIKNLPTLEELYENTIFIEGEEPNLPFCQDVTTMQKDCSEFIPIYIGGLTIYENGIFYDKIVKTMIIPFNEKTSYQRLVSNYLSAIIWKCNCLIIDIPIFCIYDRNTRKDTNIRKRIIRYKIGGFSLYDILLLLNQEYTKEFTKTEKDFINNYNITNYSNYLVNCSDYMWLVVKYGNNNYPYLSIVNNNDINIDINIKEDIDSTFLKNILEINNENEFENLINSLNDNVDSELQELQELINELDEDQESFLSSIMEIYKNTTKMNKLLNLFLK